MLYKFVFQTGWLGNRRKLYAAAGSYQAFLVVLADVYGLLDGVLILYDLLKEKQLLVKTILKFILLSTIN
jgi:hypothetical protein